MYNYNVKEFLISLLELIWFLIKLIFLWAVLILGGFFLIGLISKVPILRDIVIFVIMAFVLAKIARYISKKEEEETDEDK